MFEEFCPAHQSRVLLTPSNIEAIRNTPDGIVVTWRCWCGHRGETDRREPTASEPAVLRRAC